LHFSKEPERRGGGINLGGEVKRAYLRKAVKGEICRPGEKEKG